MKKTKCNTINEHTLCVSREQLAETLNVGLATADRIAKEAEARIHIGKRVLIKMDRINSYLEAMAE